MIIHEKDMNFINAAEKVAIAKKALDNTERFIQRCNEGHYKGTAISIRLPKCIEALPRLQKEFDDAMAEMIAAYNEKPYYLTESGGHIILNNK